MIMANNMYILLNTVAEIELLKMRYFIINKVYLARFIDM